MVTTMRRQTLVLFSSYRTNVAFLYIGSGLGGAGVAVGITVGITVWESSATAKKEAGIQH